MSFGLPESDDGKASSRYDAEYYASHLGGEPYTWENRVWRDFFATIADSLVAYAKPRTVLDAGCAIGFLVASLRGRGVDAHGIDVSTFAIGSVPKGLRPYCSVRSITEPFDRHYDVIVCIEVVEHLSPADGETAVANLCGHSDRVLFSSTPSDDAEPTHLNVRPPSYWAALFAREGFFRDFGYDATVVAPHACLFARRSPNAVALAAGYEQLYVEERLREFARAERSPGQEEAMPAGRSALLGLRSKLGPPGTARDRLLRQTFRAVWPRFKGR